MKPIFELISTDMTGVGGPMGSVGEEKWTKLFKTVEAAKACAEKDYQKMIGKKNARIKWKKYDPEDAENVYTSGDLSCVMYEIWPKEVGE